MMINKLYLLKLEDDFSSRLTKINCELFFVYFVIAGLTKTKHLFDEKTSLQLNNF